MYVSLYMVVLKAGNFDSLPFIIAQKLFYCSLSRFKQKKTEWKSIKNDFKHRNSFQVLEKYFIVSENFLWHEIAFKTLRIFFYGSKLLSTLEEIFFHVLKIFFMAQNCFQVFETNYLWHKIAFKILGIFFRFNIACKS